MKSLSKMDFPERCVQSLSYTFVYHWAPCSVAQFNACCSNSIVVETLGYLFENAIAWASLKSS